MKNIFPFLWLTGHAHDFSKEIDAIKNAGIDAFCVESRVHDEFCEDGFWQDFENVLSLAKKRNMQVWILDDKRYPTGIANEKLAQADEKKRAKRLVCDHYDALSHGEVTQLPICPQEEDKLLAAFAIPYAGGELDYGKRIDVTAFAKGKWLLPTLPKGKYRFACLYQSTRGAEKENFIDMMNPDSVRVLLDEVYEKFYARYKSDFGKTIVGFFSDEPRLCDGYTQLPLVKNTPREHTLGLVGAAYPYSTAVFEKMRARLGQFSFDDLLSLWYPCDGYERVRCAFMDAVTEEYARNFSGQIGAWCKKRGVAYAGHIIEDQGAHTSSGRSAGHYFKSQAGQNLAGVDVVLHQIKTGWTDCPSIAKVFGGFADPDFYLHTLPALAVSEAWLDENKRGSVCELFGAFGWGESARDMKWMTDVMLVGGIDHFIPHAFCPDENNDDCPPHFYENGKNPVYPAFCELMRYTKDILARTKNRKKPKVGVLYHAEAEWSGRKYESIDGVCRELCERQIPFMIVPHEKLLASGVTTLLVPDCEYLPPWVEESLQQAKTAGVEILFRSQADYAALQKRYCGLLSVVGFAPNVRILDGETPMLFYLGEGEEVEFSVSESGAYRLYDPTSGLERNVSKRFALRLERGETRLLLQGACTDPLYEKPLAMPTRYLLEREEKAGFVPVSENTEAGALNTLMPDYSGGVRYCFERAFEGGEYEWEFSALGGSVELIVDDVSQGIRLAAPARFTRITLEKGTHRIAYLFRNTLANERKDPLSFFDAREPFGLIAPPVVRRLL
ncbi:MAG: hypothetical protein IJX81_01980 [Clostridia bacterium]|nr:hypothetical protein [Clostridia bacterium]